MSQVVPIGVVLVNWNGADDTIACLESLVACRPAPSRVVVVDNASEDDSLPRLRQRVGAHSSRDGDGVPHVSIVESTRNLGFAGGNNLGISVLAKDETLGHFLLLNNDATVASDYFARLLDALRVEPNAGLVSGTIYEDADPPVLWYAGGVARLSRALMLHRKVMPLTGAPQNTEYVCGCTMLLSRRLLTTIGPLPECYYPGYWEDAEYSLRARAHGFPLIYAPAAVAHHRSGTSFGRPSIRPRVAYLKNRHRALFVRRNLRGWNRLVALGYLVATKPARALVETVRGRPALGFAILTGMLAGLRQSASERPQRETREAPRPAVSR